MSFLHPWALALGLLAAVPLLMHLSRRDARERIVFPAIRYLREARRRTDRSLRTRDRLLLATRVGIILAIAAAAAGTRVGDGGPASHAPTDVALVLDNSASMTRVSEGATALEQAVQRARRTLSFAAPGDRFWIITASGAVLAEEAEAGEAMRSLSRVRPTHGGYGLVTPARRILQRLPRGTRRPKEVLLFTDLQASAWRDDSLPPLPGVRFAVRRVGSLPAENAGITGLRLRTAPDGSASIAALTGWTAAGGRADVAAADTVELRLRVDGRLAGLARVVPGEEAAFRVSGLSRGWHVGRLELPPSGFPGDDVRHFALHEAPPPAVRHVGLEESFLARALETLEAAGRLRLQEGGIVILEGAADGGLEPAANLALVPPFDPLELARFNALLERMGVPWRAETEAARGALAVEAPAEVPALAGNAVRIRYRLRRLAEAGGRADTLIRTADGAPWLVRERDAGRRVALLASPLRPEATTLPLRPAMLAFTETLISRWLSEEEAAATGVEAGSSHLLPPRADSVRLPDGRIVRVDGGQPFVPPDAGIYRVYSSQEGEGQTAGQVTPFAAHVPAREAELSVAGVGEVRAALGDPSLAVARTEAEWGEAVFRSRLGIDRTPLLVALILALAAAEAWLAAPRRERRQGQGGRRSAAGWAR